MKKTLIVLLLFTATVIAQTTEQFNRLRVDEYNTNLEVWQNVKTEESLYIIDFNMKERTMYITRSDDNKGMVLIEIHTFRSLNGSSFMFSAFALRKEGKKLPAHGIITDFDLEINLGNYVYTFFNIAEGDKKI